MINQVLVKSVDSPEEMEAVGNLRVRVFVHEQGVPPEEEVDEYDDSAVHAVALLDGVVSGTGRVYRTPSGETHIGRMAVESNLRRRGIGGAILAYLED